MKRILYLDSNGVIWDKKLPVEYDKDGKETPMPEEKFQKFEFEEAEATLKQLNQAKRELQGQIPPEQNRQPDLVEITERVLELCGFKMPDAPLGVQVYIVNSYVGQWFLPPVRRG